MSAAPHLRNIIDRHFAGTISPRQERRLREHLPGCDACRAHYDRHLTLAQLDPNAPSAKARLAAGLGLRPQPKQMGWRLAMPGLVAAAATAALLVALWPASPRDLDGFTARGTPPRDRHIFVYRVQQGGPPQPFPTTISKNDELAFAYTNPERLARLMVFAVDEHGHIFWYHPAWTDADHDPSAVPVHGGDRRHELPEAIGHTYDGQVLHLVALLTDEQLTVRQVEDAVRSVGPTGKLPFQGAVVERFELRVGR